MEILVLVYFRFTMFYVVVRPLLFKFIVFPGCVYVCKFGSVWLDPANYFVWQFTMLGQRRKRWAGVVEMLYKSFVFAGCVETLSIQTLYVIYLWKHTLFIPSLLSVYSAIWNTHILSHSPHHYPEHTHLGAVLFYVVGRGWLVTRMRCFEAIHSHVTGVLFYFTLSSTANSKKRFVGSCLLLSHMSDVCFRLLSYHAF